MLVSWNILRKMVKPSHEPTARELADILTMSTVEVDGYTDQARDLDHIVVGEVMSVTAHPNADKLKLATVNFGSGEAEVVCGGVNLKVGMKVALAHTGARVKWHGQGDWITLETATIRGVKSKGMICAAEELGLPDPQAVEHGVMDLSYLDVKSGTPLAQALGYDDIILDIDNKSLTNRPDLWGHLGLARELGAVWQTKLEPPHTPEIVEGKLVKLKVTSKAEDKTIRYLAVAVGNITVGESPLWLKRTLASLGARSINNIVDITNYVMLELGQPMHAFDLEKLAGPEIVVREAKKGEEITTLDGVVRELDHSMLVIADKAKAIAVAGIIGGLDSAVSEATKTIILESATFEAVGVRKTSAALALRTDASARFEKALDPSSAALALRRAVALIKEVIPGAEVVSKVVDVYPSPLIAQPIMLNVKWLGKKLGVELAPTEVKNILERLGFLVETKGESFVVTPPTWRATRDVTIPEDLVEEVARMYGYGRIPLVLPSLATVPPEVDASQVLRWRVRDNLVGQGLIETLGYSFIGKKSLEQLKPEVYEAIGVDYKHLIEVVNPVNKAESYLRPALLPGLLEQLIKNVLLLPHDQVQIFEWGRVFGVEDSNWSTGQDKHFLPMQPWHLALGQRFPEANALGSFRHLKGVLENLFSTLGIAVEFIAYGNTMAKMLVAGQHIGGLGILPKQRSSLTMVIGFAELFLDASAVTDEKYIISPDIYETVVRDISIVVPSTIAWDDIEKVLKKVSPLLKTIELFDVYEEASLGADKRSLAFHLTFSSGDKTLKSEEVDKIVVGAIKLLEKSFNATIRI